MRGMRCWQARMQVNRRDCEKETLLRFSPYDQAQRPSFAFLYACLAAVHPVMRELKPFQLRLTFYGLSASPFDCSSDADGTSTFRAAAGLATIVSTDCYAKDMQRVLKLFWCVLWKPSSPNRICGSISGKDPEFERTEVRSPSGRFLFTSRLLGCGGWYRYHQAVVCR